MRDALATADETELAEIFDAFDVKATYDKPDARLELATPSAPEQAPRTTKAAWR